MSPNNCFHRVWKNPSLAIVLVVLLLVNMLPLVGGLGGDPAHAQDGQCRYEENLLQLYVAAGGKLNEGSIRAAAEAASPEEVLEVLNLPTTVHLTVAETIQRGISDALGSDPQEYPATPVDELCSGDYGLPEQVGGLTNEQAYTLGWGALGLPTRDGVDLRQILDPYLPDPTDPTPEPEPTDPTDPTPEPEPTDPTDPTPEPVIEPTDPTLQPEPDPTDPTLQPEPDQPEDPTNPTPQPEPDQPEDPTDTIEAEDEPVIDPSQAITTTIYFEADPLADAPYEPTRTVRWVGQQVTTTLRLQDPVTEPVTVTVVADARHLRVVESNGEMSQTTEVVFAPGQVSQVLTATFELTTTVGPEDPGFPLVITQVQGPAKIHRDPNTGDRYGSQAWFKMADYTTCSLDYMDLNGDGRINVQDTQLMVNMGVPQDVWKRFVFCAFNDPEGTGIPVPDSLPGDEEPEPEPDPDPQPDPGPDTVYLPLISRS